MVVIRLLYRSSVVISRLLCPVRSSIRSKAALASQGLDGDCSSVETLTVANPEDPDSTSSSRAAHVDHGVVDGNAWNLAGSVSGVSCPPGSRMNAVGRVALLPGVGGVGRIR